MMKLIVINAHKNNTIVAEQTPRELEAWIHHREPVAVIATTCLSVGLQIVALGIYLPRLLQVALERGGEVIVVHEVAASVIRRVYINHFYLLEICFLQ